MHGKFFRCLAAGIMMAGMPSFAQNTNTNVMAAFEISASVPPLENTGPRDRFWNEYSRQIELQADNIALDQLGYGVHSLDEVRRLNREGYGYIDGYGRKGANAIRSIFLGPLRDTLADRLPVEQWEYVGLGFFAHFLANSIGNTAEERQDPLATTPSYEDIVQKESLWHATRRNYDVECGFRPLTGSPYGFLGFNVGKQTDGLPIVHIDLRCSVRLDSLSDFGQLQIKGRFIVPITRDYDLVIGGAIEPLGTKQPGSVVMFRHTLGTHGSLAFCSWKNDQRGSTYDAGFSIPWPERISLPRWLKLKL